MERETYEDLEIETVAFENEDVILSSCDPEQGNE